MFYVRHSTSGKHRIYTALSSQLFKNCTSCAVFNSGFEHSTKPIKWSFDAHPCAELEDTIEHTAISCIGRVLRGGKPLSAIWKMEGVLGEGRNF